MWRQCFKSLLAVHTSGLCWRFAHYITWSRLLLVTWRRLTLIGRVWGGAYWFIRCLIERSDLRGLPSHLARFHLPGGNDGSREVSVNKKIAASSSKSVLMKERLGSEWYCLEGNGTLSEIGQSGYLQLPYFYMVLTLLQIPFWCLRVVFADHLVKSSQHSFRENTRMSRQTYQMNGKAASYCDSNPAYQDSSLNTSTKEFVNNYRT